MASRREEIEKKLQLLRDSYLQQVPGWLLEIESLWSQLQQQWAADTLTELYTCVHRLSGASLSFNCAALGAAARDVEQSLAPFRSSSAAPISGDMEVIAQKLTLLQQAGAATKPR